MKNEYHVSGSTAFIHTASGHVIQIDAEDLPLVENTRWNVYTHANRPEPMVLGVVNKKQRLFWHIIMEHYHGSFDGQEVDHVDGNRLNNRKSNLRLATRQVNCLNRRPYGQHTPFKNTYPTRTKGVYQVTLTHEGKTRHGGRYSDLNEAAQAADRLSMKLRGPLLLPHNLNFPHLWDTYVAEYSGSLGGNH